MIKQLPLSVQLRDDATFTNFYVGDNQELLFYLQSLFNNQEKFFYLWGSHGAGKTHLLQACCHQAQQNNLAVIYLSLKQIIKLSPELLENIETLSLICLDDLDAISQQPLWQEALFHCYNRITQTGAKLIVAATVPPKSLSLQLSDLTSRLSASVIFQLHALNDEQKVRALQLRAKIRGMQLPRNVAEFLLNHYQRDSDALFNVLEKLDQASLAAQRKLSIPFVKLVL